MNRAEVLPLSEHLSHYIVYLTNCPIKRYILSEQEMSGPVYE